MTVGVAGFTKLKQALTRVLTCCESAPACTAFVDASSASEEAYTVLMDEQLRAVSSTQQGLSWLQYMSSDSWSA